MSALFLMTATQNKGKLLLDSTAEFAKRQRFFFFFLISHCLRNNDPWHQKKASHKLLKVPPSAPGQRNLSIENNRQIISEKVPSLYGPRQRGQKFKHWLPRS